MKTLSGFPAINVSHNISPVYFGCITDFTKAETNDFKMTVNVVMFYVFWSFL